MPTARLADITTHIVNKFWERDSTVRSMLNKFEHVRGLRGCPFIGDGAVDVPV